MTSRWKLIFSLAGIFLLGGVTGGALIRMKLTKSVPAKPPAQAANLGPEQWGPNQLKNFVLALDLSPDQAEDLKLIIDDAMIELRRLQRNSRIETAKLLDKMEAEIEPLLSPDQLAKLKAVQVERRERLRQQLEERAKQARQAAAAAAAPAPGK